LHVQVSEGISNQQKNDGRPHLCYSLV
jgi:hypothetical protein